MGLILECRWFQLISGGIVYYRPYSILIYTAAATVERPKLAGLSLHTIPGAGKALDDPVCNKAEISFKLPPQRTCSVPQLPSSGTIPKRRGMRATPMPFN